MEPNEIDLYLAHLRRMNYSPHTVKAVRFDLEPLRTKSKGSPVRQLLGCYQDAERNGRRPSTLNRLRSSLVGFQRYRIKMGWDTEELVLPGLPKKRSPRLPVRPSAVERPMSRPGPNRLFQEERDNLIIDLVQQFGLTPLEVARLRTFGMGMDRLSVEPGRALPLPSPLAERLRSYVRRHAIDGPLFPTKRHGGYREMCTRTAERILKRATGKMPTSLRAMRVVTLEVTETNARLLGYTRTSTMKEMQKRLRAAGPPE